MSFPDFPFMPPDLSTHGQALDDLTWWVHIIMAILFVGWGAFFLYTLVRFRSGANPKANYGGMKSHFSTYHEVIIVVIECVLLFALAIPLWANWADGAQNRKTEGNALHIRVVAQQFGWNVQYPGPDGKLGKLSVSRINESFNPIGLDRRSDGGADDFQIQNSLFIPVNRPVIVDISTKDVIHSFFLPAMRVKQDAMPGMRIPITFEANKTTMQYKKEEFAETPGKYQAAHEIPDFEIACAQLCGAQHFKMTGKFYILSAEDFTDETTLTDLLTWSGNFTSGNWEATNEGQAGN